MLFADCLVHKVDRESGEVAVLVGELLVPDRFKDIQPGMYDVEFEIAIDKDKRIGGRVADMVAKKPAVRAPSPSSSVARGGPSLPAASVGPSVPDTGISSGVKANS